MTPSNRLRYGSLGLLAGAAGATAYALRIRPHMLHWGATHHELERSWKSDRLLPEEADFEATRAVTIHAPAKDVWKWIVQIGQDRAGFYSYEWPENLLGFDIHNIEEIVPEFQDRKQGDVVWIGSPERFGGERRLIVGLLESKRMMALVHPLDAEAVSRGGEAVHGYWAFHLEPIDDDSCRLVMRTKGARNPRFGKRVARRLFWEVADFLLERRMMKNIKTLAEEEVVAG